MICGDPCQATEGRRKIQLVQIRFLQFRFGFAHKIIFFAVCLIFAGETPHIFCRGVAPGLPLLSNWEFVLAAAQAAERRKIVARGERFLRALDLGMHKRAPAGMRVKLIQISER